MHRLSSWVQPYCRRGTRTSACRKIILLRLPIYSHDCNYSISLAGRDQLALSSEIRKHGISLDYAVLL